MTDRVQFFRMDVWTIWISPSIFRRLQLDRFAIVRFEWLTVIGNGDDRLKRRNRNKADGPFGRCTVFTHEHPVCKRAHITRMSSIRAARRSVIYVALWKCHGRAAAEEEVFGRRRFRVETGGDDRSRGRRRTTGRVIKVYTVIIRIHCAVWKK